MAAVKTKGVFIIARAPSSPEAVPVHVGKLATAILVPPGTTLRVAVAQDGSYEVTYERTPRLTAVPQ